MHRFVAALAVVAAFTPALAFAADAPPAQPAPAPVEVGVQTAADAATTQADAGRTTLDRCPKDSPYIEYRDCINASTQRAEAKVRMA